MKRGMVLATAMTLFGATSHANASTVDVSVWLGQYNDTGSSMAVVGAPSYTSTLSSGSTGFYFDWNSINTSTNQFGATTANNVFTADFSGVIDATTAGTYSITIGSDDASYLFVNGSLAISDGGAHGTQDVTDNVALNAGSNTFLIEYGNYYCCGATTSLTLNSAGSTVSSVPEPSTWAMLVIGFAGVGFAGYRQSRRQSVVTVAAV